MLSQVAEMDTEGRLRKATNPRLLLEALLLRFAHVDRASRSRSCCCRLPRLVVWGKRAVRCQAPTEPLHRRLPLAQTRFTAPENAAPSTPQPSAPASATSCQQRAGALQRILQARVTRAGLASFWKVARVSERGRTGSLWSCLRAPGSNGSARKRPRAGFWKASLRDSSVAAWSSRCVRSAVVVPPRPPLPSGSRWRGSARSARPPGRVRANAEKGRRGVETEALD